ncbi:MAG: TonB-dependent receptor [Aureispira sp.]|nr:TonB-dependent receptor [Aureispira sp.]
MQKTYKYILLQLLIFCCCNTVYSQEQRVVVQAHQQPLSVLLEQLQKEYGIQFSCNNELLKNCIIDADNSYETCAEALEHLLTPCQLSYKKVNNIYIITKAKPSLSKQEKPKVKYFNFRGQIIDSLSQEPLPFANIQINNSIITSDVNGKFAYRSKDSLATIQVSHLGYHNQKARLTPSQPLQLELTTTSTQLKEVIVEAPPQIASLDLEIPSNLMKANHEITRFLPGNNNNSIFDLLRLQPGILAAGEQSKDYIIWGSYKGQSHIVFDGITIFNTSSQNEHIGTINPSIISDIEVYKGGYNVHLGDRVGSLVTITSKNGDNNAFHYAFNFNNQSINNYLNIPLSLNSSLQIGTRIAYPNLFDPKTYVFEKPSIFFFGDLNLKYTNRFHNGDQFNISLLGNIDNYDEEWEEEEGTKYYHEFTQNHNYQFGGSAYYGKQWRKLGLSNIRIAYSRFNNTHNNILEFEDGDRDIHNGFEEDSLSQEFEEHFTTQNHIEEISLKIDHIFPATRWHQLSIGLSLIHNNAGFYQDSIEHILSKKGSELTRTNIYIKDRFQLGKYLSIEPGLRLDIPLNGSKPRFQPRIKANIHPHPNWKLHLAYGWYNQFISQNALIDNFENYLYLWNIGEDESVPVLSSIHYVAGLSNSQQYFNWSIEGYYKTTNNITRFYRDFNTKNLTSRTGNSRSYGLDVYAQTTFKRQKIWLAYSLSKTEEKFDGQSQYQAAPQDQRHELKATGIFNVHPFYFSVNYVYGTGFSETANILSKKSLQPYSRLDIGALYQFRSKRLKLETGVSVLNVLNTKNIRYNDFSGFPGNKKSYSSAIPISPTLFLNVSF